MMRGARMVWLAGMAGLAGCATPPAYTTRGLREPLGASVQVREQLPVIKAEVGDQRVDLVWDLGATHALSLPLHVLERIGAEETGERVRFEDAGGHTLEARVFVVDSVRWAGVHWRGVRAVEAVWSAEHAPPLKLGVLGRPLFDGLRLVLRLGEGEVVVEPGGGCGADGVELEHDQGLFVKARLGGEQVLALLDTAATANITTNKRWQGEQALTIHKTALGVEEFRYAPLSGLPAEVLLGMPFWLKHEVVLDLGGRCAWFAPVSGG